MTVVVPQAVVERIFAFMSAGKTGRIELQIKAGRLLGVDVTESVRVRPDEPGASPGSSRLDGASPVPQDGQP